MGRSYAVPIYGLPDRIALLVGMLALLNPAASPFALWLWLTGSLLLVYFGSA